MLDSLRQAFRDAVSNFKHELHRDRIPPAVDQLLHGMHEEVTEAQAGLRRLEEEIRRTVAEAEREAREAETCRRREAMASRIGDDETAAVAVEFAEKHERRRDVLQRKALAMREELDVRRAEVDEMLEKVKHARHTRASLTATQGRADARSAIQGAEDLFDELDRMAERISETQSRAEAAEEIWSELDEGPRDSGASAPPPPDVDARLRELKRRMGRD